VSTGTIGLAIEGSLARITLDQPARHNAMSLGMWRLLPERIEAALTDSRVRAILVTGAGERAFCSGADISEFGSNRADPGSATSYDEAVHAAIEALRNAEKPTIAQIRGICFGGGLEIALCCDLRVGSSSARFRLPAARLGLGYAYANVALFVEKLGAAATAEIIFTAATLDGEAALSAGIVQRVFPEETFTRDSDAYVASIAANAPLVLKAVKRSLLELAKPAGQRDVASAALAVAACITSQDYLEGQAAFRERREPRFTGQ
jgi:enoyl-CoA hydratase/carnithine racemase